MLWWVYGGCWRKRRRWSRRRRQCSNLLADSFQLRWGQCLCIQNLLQTKKCRQFGSQAEVSWIVREHVLGRANQLSDLGLQVSEVD
jgi:hypothetical protein